MRFLRPIAVVDVETTGTDTEKHGIVQIGAVFMSGNLEILDTYESRCNPGEVEIDPKAMAVHRISRRATCEANLISKIIEKFARKVKKNTLFCSWGPYFDRNFLTQAFWDAHIDWPFGFEVFDIKSAAHTFLATRGHVMEYGGLDNYLSALGIEKQGKSHDALADAINTAHILQAID